MFPGILTGHAGPQGQCRRWLLPEPAQSRTDSQAGVTAPRAGGHRSQLCLSPLGKQGSERDAISPESAELGQLEEATFRVT